MNSDKLKSMQAPIKEGYRNQPETAVVTRNAARFPPVEVRRDP